LATNAGRVETVSAANAFEKRILRDNTQTAKTRVPFILVLLHRPIR
jgi:hypothetical protein